MYVAFFFIVCLFFIVCFCYKNILNFILYTELFWIFSFFFLCSCSLFFDDSRFFTLAFIFLILATLEVISFSLVLLIKMK